MATVRERDGDDFERTCVTRLIMWEVTEHVASSARGTTSEQDERETESDHDEMRSPKFALRHHELMKIPPMTINYHSGYFLN